MIGRKKILIIEYDDFLRELLGNLLHKKGYYILNGYSVADGLKESQKNDIDIVILGTSVPEFKGKETLAYLTRTFNQTVPPEFFIINETGMLLDYITPHRQYMIEQISVQTIIDDIMKLS